MNLLTKDLKYLVIEYIVDPPQKFINLIKVNRVLFKYNIWKQLSSNPNAINFIRNNIDKIDYGLLSCNTNATDIIEKNFSKINWYNACINPNITIFKERLNMIDWNLLSLNPMAISLLEQCPNISWYNLCKNPGAIHMIEKELNTNLSYYTSEKYSSQDKIDLGWLSENPAAMHILEKYSDKIHWTYILKNPSAMHLIENRIYTHVNNLTTDMIKQLCMNPNPKVLNLLYPLIESVPYVYKIDWSVLSQNPSAIPLLRKYPHKIDYDVIFKNPSVFELDKKEFKILKTKYKL